MNVVELRFYGSDAPNGTVLGTLTEGELERLELYVPERGPGAGLLEVDRSLITPAMAAPGNVVKVTFPYIDADPVWAFLLDEAIYRLLSEQDSDTITIGGPGLLGLLKGARLLDVPYAPGQPWRGSVTMEGIWHWVNQPYGAIATRLIEEGQNQTGLPLEHVTVDFDRDVDSNGLPWDTIDETYELGIGASIEEALANITDTGDFLLRAQPNLLFQAFQSWGINRTSATYAAGKVRLTVPNLLTEVERAAHGFGAWTHVLMEDNAGNFTTVISPDYVAGTPARWGYLRIGTTDDAALVQKIGANALRQQRLGLDSVELEIVPGDDELNGRYLPFKHFVPGDTLTLHTGTEDHDYDDAAMILRGVRITLTDADGATAATAHRSLRVVLELNSGTDADGGTVGGVSRGGGGSGNCDCPQPCRASIIGSTFSPVAALGSAGTLDSVNYDAVLVTGPQVERVRMNVGQSCVIGQCIVVVTSHRGSHSEESAVYDQRGNVYAMAAEYFDPDGDVTLRIWYTDLSQNLSVGDYIGFEVGGASLGNLEKGGKVITAYLFNGGLASPVESGNADAFGSSPAVAVGAGDLLVAAVGWKGGSSGFPDTITQDPDWTPFTSATTGAHAADSQAVVAGFRVADADGETYSATIDQARDWAALGAIFSTTSATAVSGDMHPELVGTGNRYARCGHSHVLLRTVAPTTSDDEESKIPETTLWVNTLTGETWLLVDNTAGAAVWISVGTGMLNPMTAAGDIVIGGVSGDPDRLPIGAAGRHLVSRSGTPAWEESVLLIPFIIDGAGAAIATGVKGDIGPFNFAGEIVAVAVLADQSGSIVIDLWKDSYANFPPVVGNTITASAKPTISAATKSKDTTLTGWTKAIAVDDIIRVNVDSATTITRVTLALHVKKV